MCKLWGKSPPPQVPPPTKRNFEKEKVFSGLSPNYLNNILHPCSGQLEFSKIPKTFNRSTNRPPL